MEDEAGDMLDSLTLPGELGSVPRARHFVEQTLTDRTDDLPALALMTSELVTNVAAHAPSDFTVTVRAGPPIRVEVHDGVAATQAFRDLISAGGAMPESSDVGGRGLALLRRLATEVGLDDDARGGKVVWFEL